ncbi:MAG: cytochrome c biogenesis protein CcdA [Pseudomonadota bacterium]
MSKLLVAIVVLLCSSLAWAAEAGAPLDVRMGEWIGSAVAQGSLLLAVGIAFVAGVAVSLSPCVYPLIPITIAVFGAREKTGYLRGFTLSLAYVVGMALFYSAFAIVFALLGLASGSLMAMPAVVLSIATLGLVMAASLFGAFELVIPASWQTRLSTVGGAGHLGAFLMGLAAGVIAAPCAGPVLVFILALIAKEGNPLLGAALMVAYAFGIGLLFLILGTFSQLISRMPKSGRWMETARSTLGLGMLLAALYIALPHVPPLRAFVGLNWHGSGIAIALGMIALGLVAGALHLSFHDGTLATVRKVAGIALATAGLLGMVGVLHNAPLPSRNDAQRVWLHQHDPALELGRTQGKPVLIDFGAEWCVACKELKKHVFTTAEFREEAARFVLVDIDCTELSDEVNRLWELYGIRGLPNIVFIDSQGLLVPDLRITSFVDAKHFVAQMRKVR